MRTASRVRPLLVGVALALVPAAAGAQPPAPEPPPPPGFTRQVLGRFDLNPDGTLDGVELSACRCADFDTNRDAKVSLAEFDAGYRAADLRRRVTLHTLLRSPLEEGAARATGGRAAATPTAAPGGTPNVWNTPDPRGAAARSPVRAAATAPAAATEWRAGQRVEVSVDGTWTGATVLRMGEGDEAGQVRVSLDGYTYGVSRMEWVDAGRVRAPRAAAAPPAAPRGLPAALPAGRYVCNTSLTYYAATQMTIGRVRLRPGGTYTGMSQDASGGGGRYRYDPAAGTIEWAGGLQGFTGILNGTTVARDKNGTPYFTLAYQARPGGNAFEAACTREGA